MRRKRRSVAPSLEMYASTATTAPKSTHVDTRNGGAIPAPLGVPKEAAPSLENTHSPTKAEAQAPSSTATAGTTTTTSTHHLNVSVLHGITYPSARAVTIAKEAVDAAQMYYNLFFQANESTASTNSSGQSGVKPQVQRSSSSQDGGVSPGIPHPHPRLHSSPTARQHSPNAAHAHRSDLAHPTESAERRMPSVASQEDVPQQRSNLHIGSVGGASGHTSSREEGQRLSRTSSVQSNDASQLSVQTPVNVVDTAYHTFFPPLLSSVRREEIVERIVGHRPRPYHQWEWHKAEDYHALHAQNVHHNNVYHKQPSEAADGAAGSGSGAAAAAASSTSAASGQATLETPLSTSPSYPSMSPVARIAGCNGGRASGEGSDVTGVLTGATTPHPPSATRGLDASASAGSVDETGVHAAAHEGSNSGKASAGGTTGATTSLAGGGEAAAAAAPALPKVSSFLLNEMPFELMSQLSMYTIPTSQQGPEYFKKTAEDGTKTLIIFMMGLPARGKTFLAQKICRLLGWHGSRAKVQNIQVAWRRVLLDWEATHADHLAEDGRRHGEAHTSGHDGNDDPSGASAASTRPPSPISQASTVVGVPDIHLARRRAHHALSGQHPSHSSTQDEVSRVVRDLATGALSALQRRSTDGTVRTAMTTTTNPTPIPAVPAARGSHPPTREAATGEDLAQSRPPAPCTLPSLLPTSTGPPTPSCTVTGATTTTSPVCPSMEPFTAVAPDEATFPSVPSSAAASPNTATAASDFASDVAVAGSPLDAALHSHPLSPTTAGAAGINAALSCESSPAEAPVVEGAAPSSRGAARPAMPAEVLRTRHFKELVQSPDSVARRLYRYVLQSFADDCKMFFQHGGEVVVINDDFVTEELRLEAEKLFRPLASQFFYMEVIRDAEEDPLDFVQCKIRDPIEYPRGDIDLRSATVDFNERLRFLESVYETLEEAPKTKTEERMRAAARERASAQQQQQEQQQQQQADEDAGRVKAQIDVSTKTPHQRTRSYVKIRNANAIETHGISGYLASRIISYVMNLSQVKIQHPIYFVRHGESCYNLEDRIGGNPLLTEQGMRDAGALLEFLASLKHHLKHVDHVQRAQHAGPPTPPPRQQPNLGEHDDPSAYTANAGVGTNNANALEMWTSQLRRAIQTAELSERLLNIRTLRWSSLNEIHAGVCEDMTYDEVSQRYPLIDYFRKRSKYTFRYPEGESYQDLVVRLEPVIMELENADKVVVVVAHQAVLRCLLAYFGSTSAESSISVEVPHRTVWRCTYDSKGIASLDELKLDNYEAGFQLRKTVATGEAVRETPTASPAPATAGTQ